MELRINDRIRNRKVEFFNNFNVNLRYDSVASAFSFSFYFDPTNREHVEMSCIGHYHEAMLDHGGQRILTGYILSQAFSDSRVRELVSFGGYSLPGVLEDCQIPPQLYPLQYDGLTLREIAQKILPRFNLKMIVDTSVSARMDEVFETITANETESIKDFLTKLAAQKNIIISHDPQGRVLFTMAKTNQQPLLNFDGGIPFTRMSLSFNGQGMHSDITVMKEASDDGGNAGEITLKNPYVPFVYRPRVVTQSSGDDNNTEQAARNILSEELKNFKLTIVTDRWDVDGKIIMPNNVITVVNPKIYLFKPTKWFIEGVALQGDNQKLTATLDCVPCEVYNNQTPQYPFKGINLHD